MSAFFALRSDVERPGRWWLGRLTNARGDEVDVCDFTESTSPVPGAASAGLRFAVKHAGESLDFTFGPFGIPVLRRELALIIAGLANDDVDVVPVTIDGALGDFAILHILCNIDALDLGRTRHTLYTDEETRDGLEHVRGVPKYLDPDFTLHAGPSRGPACFGSSMNGVTIVVARPVHDAMLRQGRLTTHSPRATLVRRSSGPAASKLCCRRLARIGSEKPPRTPVLAPRVENRTFSLVKLSASVHSPE